MFVPGAIRPVYVFLSVFIYNFLLSFDSLFVLCFWCVLKFTLSILNN